MKAASPKFLRRLAAILLCAAALFAPHPADAYSVLSHEEVVDMAWKPQMVPMLKARFPGISDDDIRQAHAYAYGGSVIQDIGYYPFGSHYFSDLLHYVRPDEFVNALIRDSTTPDEYAFALGALAHFCGDMVGHPAVNLVVAQQNPPLEHRFGRTITYAEDPTAHLRTEFGFDVVEVAQGHYSQENYRDFIGFQVAKPLLERAFQQTYGIPMGDVIKHEDLAIGSYRRAVSTIVPKMTTLAFMQYKDQIQQAAPGMEKRKFLYRLNQTEFKKEFGTDYYHVGVGGHIASFFLRLVPKVGPFKALKVTLPNGQQQDVYIKSINTTVDRFRLYLAEIHAAPAPLPPATAKDVQDARKAADKAAKDAEQAKRLAAQEQDPGEKARLQQAAVDVQKTSELAAAAAAREQAKVVDQATDSPSHPAIPADTPIQPPTTPKLPEVDLDTGHPSGSGEYLLADETYAKLLAQLVKAGGPRSAQAHLDVSPALAVDIQRFYANPVAPSGPPPSAHAAEREAALTAQVQADLALLKAATPAQP